MYLFLMSRKYNRNILLRGISKMLIIQKRLYLLIATQQLVILTGSTELQLDYHLVTLSK